VSLTALRYEGLTGTLGAAHNDSTTTLTLAAKLTHEGGDVPTIASPNFLDLSILDANGKCVEIVRVTAYTSAATSATVTRGAAGTTANAHDNGATFIHGVTASEQHRIEGGEARVNIVAATGATETLPAAYSAHDCTMDQACEYTFPTPTQKGHSFALVLRGAFTPTFPASVDWAGGSAPTYTTPSLYVFTTVDGGTNWLGSLVGKAFA
jgi:hypothetical protein